MEIITNILNYIFSPELTWLNFFGLMALGALIEYKLLCFLIGWDCTYNNGETIKEVLQKYLSDEELSKYNFSEQQMKNQKKTKDNLNEVFVEKEKAEKRLSRYNQENIFREKQEIIKRNTAKEKHCGLCENGECKFVGYCKHQRKYTEYGCDKVILCMREGKEESKKEGEK